MKWASKLFSNADSKIKSSFSLIREVLAEGNSFFRSVGFAYLENMLMDQDLSSLFNLLTTVLPSLTFVTPKDTGVSQYNFKIINHADNLHKYLAEKLVVLAEACIDNFEKKGKKRIKYNSLFLTEMFNKDKIFDFSVVMLMRTMLYDVAEDKKKRKIQEVCKDEYREIELNEEIFELMAMATKARISYYKNGEEYFCYNNKSSENIKIVSREKEKQMFYSIAYDEKFVEKNKLY